MAVEDIGEVIAERVVKRSANGGEPTNVVIRLGKPRPSPDHACFLTPFTVDGLGERQTRYAAGIDAFQSLQLALRMIPVFLHHYAQEPGVEMFLLEPGDDLGFPDERL
jgi:hypothetical protein